MNKDKLYNASAYLHVQVDKNVIFILLARFHTETSLVVKQAARAGMLNATDVLFKL